MTSLPPSADKNDCALLIFVYQQLFQGDWKPPVSIDNKSLVINFRALQVSLTICETCTYKNKCASCRGVPTFETIELTVNRKPECGQWFDRTIIVWIRTFVDTVLAECIPVHQSADFWKAVVPATISYMTASFVPENKLPLLVPSMIETYHGVVTVLNPAISDTVYKLWRCGLIPRRVDNYTDFVSAIAHKREGFMTLLMLAHYAWLDSVVFIPQGSLPCYSLEYEDERKSLILYFDSRKMPESAPLVIPPGTSKPRIDQLVAEWSEKNALLDAMGLTEDTVKYIIEHSKKGGFKREVDVITELFDRLKIEFK